jgi:hypothetical protein
MDIGSPTGPASASLQWPLLPRTVTPPVGAQSAENLDSRCTEAALDAISRTTGSGFLGGDPVSYHSSERSLSSRASQDSASGDSQEALSTLRSPIGALPFSLSRASSVERRAEPLRPPARQLAPLVPPLPSHGLYFGVPRPPSLAPRPVVRRTERERVERVLPSALGHKRPLVDSETELDEATQTRDSKRRCKEGCAAVFMGD